MPSLLFLILGYTWVQAKDYSSAPERGVLIGIVPDKKAIKSTEGVKFSVVRFYVLLVSAFLPRVDVLDRNTVLKVVPMANNNLLQGDYETGKTFPYPDWTGYVRLLRDRIGHPPTLPPFQYFPLRKIKVSYPLL